MTRDDVVSPARNVGLLGDPVFEKWIGKLEAIASKLPVGLYDPEVIEAAAAAISDPNNPAYSGTPVKDQWGPETDEAFAKRVTYREEYLRETKELLETGLGQLPPVVLPDLELIPITDRVQMAGSMAGDDAAEEEAMRQWDAENPIEVPAPKEE